MHPLTFKGQELITGLLLDFLRELDVDVTDIDPEKVNYYAMVIANKSVSPDLFTNEFIPNA